MREPMTSYERDVFRFDPSWGSMLSNNEPVPGPDNLQLENSDTEASLGQTLLLERARQVLLSKVPEKTMERVQAQPQLLAEPTARFVTHHFLRIYRHQILNTYPTSVPESGPHLQWIPDATGTLQPYLNLDLRKPLEHVQQSLVDATIKDSKVVVSLVEQALNATCTWFCKELEPQAPERMSDDDILAAYESFLQKHSLHKESLSYLISLCAQNLARGLMETMEPTLRQASLEEVEQLLGLRAGRKLQKLPPPKQVQEYLEVMNSAHYHAIRDALARRQFVQTDESPWPTATLDKGRAKGFAELRPAAMDLLSFVPPDEEKLWVDRMWKQREELSDLDADALDALSSIWLKQAKNIDQDAVADVDELLEMRGVLQKKSGNGRRGGYHQAQRAEMLCALSHIQNLWMNMTEMEVYEEAPGRKRKGPPKVMAVKSRAFTITDMMGQLRFDGHMDVSRFIFRPGKVFASFLFNIGRQTALLSARALRYDSYRQRAEKRLTRYLSWQWRCQASSGSGPKAYRAATLIEAIGDPLNERHPGRVRDRLEKVLDTLQTDRSGV
jgi:hypothetical protein